MLIQNHPDEQTVETVLDSLCGVPALKTISLDAGSLEYLLAKHEIFRDPRIETIVCRATVRHHTPNMEAAGAPEDVKQRVVYEVSDEMRELDEEYVVFSILLTMLADAYDSMMRMFALDEGIDLMVDIDTE